MLVAAVMLMAAMGAGATAQDQISSRWPESTQPDSSQPESNQFSSLADSLFVLGESYEAGEWVRQSDLLAYMWYLLATTAGYAPADSARHRMATRLSPAEIAAAQALARQCHATNYWRCGETTVAEDLPSIVDSASALQ